MEACKVRIQKPMELKLAPGLTCYVTTQPLAEESKQLALKQQTREGGKYHSHNEGIRPNR